MKKRKGGMQINEQQLLEHMIDCYQNLIFSICYKLTGNYFDSQDLTQETFLSAYKNFSRFDRTNEKAWLCKIATNKCLDYVKCARHNTVATEDIFFENLETAEPSPEVAYMESNLKDQLLAQCSQLSPPYDVVAKAYFYEELSIHEIAVKLNRNERTLRTQVYRAKGMLRKLYRKEMVT